MSFLYLSSIAIVLVAYVNSEPLAVTATQSWQTSITSSSSSNFNFWWNQCVGSGHGSLSLREDWQQQMKAGHEQIGFTSVRFHGILDDDVGSVNGVTDFSFVNIDKSYDYMVSIGMHPYVEMSFMPAALAGGSTTSRMHYHPNITPPKSWSQWNAFVVAWMQHLIGRYGVAVVSQWQFEVWNEPNCGFYVEGGCCGCDCPYYDEYMELYRNTATSIKSVSAQLRVGGPSTAQLCWIEQFLDQCASDGIPVDFVASHLYPTDPQVNQTAYGIHAFYQALDDAAQIVTAYNKQHSKSLKLYLSEMNSGLYGKAFGNHDSNYAAAFMVYMALNLQALTDEYELMSYWAISDIFEEQGFHSQPFNNEFGLQTIRGIAKPGFRAMQLLYEFGSNTSYATTKSNGNSANDTLQAYCLRNPSDAHRYSVFAANWNFNGAPVMDQTLQISVSNAVQNGVPKSAHLYRIDANHTNPMTKWKSMGSPEYPTAAQLQALNQTSQLIASAITFHSVNSNTAQFTVDVPAYGVVVIDMHY